MLQILRDSRTFLKHGQPLQVLDMGETALDEDTFDEYLIEMKDNYTAEKVRSH